MNDKDFDDLVAKIQGEVFAEAKAALGEKGFDRWRNPRFNGKMENPDGYGRLTGDCGDTIEIFLRIDPEHELVREVSYTTDGCGSSSVAASFTAELATGKSFEEVLDLQKTDVRATLDRFPETEEHCIHLAVTTLKEALNTYLIKHMGSKAL